MNEKVPKKVKKWKFCVFHVFSRSLFSVFSVKTKKWKTLITGNRWRQSWKNPWNLVRTLIDGTRKRHKILKFAKLFQNNYQCNFALTAKWKFHRNIVPALAGFQRVSPWSNPVHVTHAETRHETTAGESIRLKIWPSPTVLDRFPWCAGGISSI